MLAKDVNVRYGEHWLDDLTRPGSYVVMAVFFATGTYTESTYCQYTEFMSEFTETFKKQMRQQSKSVQTKGERKE